MWVGGATPSVEVAGSERERRRGFWTHETSMLRVLDLYIMAPAKHAPKTVITATGQTWTKQRRSRELRYSLYRLTSGLDLSVCMKLIFSSEYVVELLGLLGFRVHISRDLCHGNTCDHVHCISSINYVISPRRLINNVRACGRHGHVRVVQFQFGLT